jgi:hypothetical protein
VRERAHRIENMLTICKLCDDASHSVAREARSDVKKIFLPVVFASKPTKNEGVRSN